MWPLTQRLANGVAEMSCKHGNWECEECEAEEKAWDSAFEAGKKEGWEACETCHGIVDGVNQQFSMIQAEVGGYRELGTKVERIARLKAELETERMRLAACGVVALANTPESAAKARDMLPEYYSGSCEDVAQAVDREMALRDRAEQLEAENKRLREFCEFAWRDVPMNEYAFEKLEALLAATKPKPEESSLARG